MEETFIFKHLDLIVYIFCFILSVIAGILVYSGLTTKGERMQTRIRIRNSIEKNRKKVVENSKQSKAEEWLKKAQYPLGLNGIRYNLIIGGFILFLITYYVTFPILLGEIGKGTMIAFVCILIFGLLALPHFPYSLFCFIMKRVIDYHNAKKYAEVFLLYDLLINEIEMMTVNRINTYNVLRNIKSHFIILEKSFTVLLSSWSNDEGPKVALDKFAEELGSKESQSLIAVIKTLDDVERSTALNHLKGMHSMFTRSQIENYRRRKKIMTDLLGIPIKATHFIIILNFMVVIVTMVTIIMSNSRL